MKLPFQTAGGVEGAPAEPVYYLSDWNEAEVAMLISTLAKVEFRALVDQKPVYGAPDMLRALMTCELRKPFLNNYDAAVAKVIKDEIPFTREPIAFVPKCAYVIHEQDGKMYVENIHGTRRYEIPEDAVKRQEVPTPLSFTYHIPFAHILFEGPVHIGYDHGLAIWFAEEYVMLLNDPHVKQWSVYHKSNPLLRVRNPR